MYARLCVCVDMRMGGCMPLCMYACLYVCMCVHVCVGVCACGMYVCACVCVEADDVSGDCMSLYNTTQLEFRGIAMCMYADPPTTGQRGQPPSVLS